MVDAGSSMQDNHHRSHRRITVTVSSRYTYENIIKLFHKIIRAFMIIKTLIDRGGTNAPTHVQVCRTVIIWWQFEFSSCLKCSFIRAARIKFIWWTHWLIFYGPKKLESASSSDQYLPRRRAWIPIWSTVKLAACSFYWIHGFPVLILPVCFDNFFINNSNCNKL